MFLCGADACRLTGQGRGDDPEELLSREPIFNRVLPYLRGGSPATPGVRDDQTGAVPDDQGHAPVEVRDISNVVVGPGHPNGVRAPGVLKGHRVLIDDFKGSGVGHTGERDGGVMAMGVGVGHPLVAIFEVFQLETKPINVQLVECPADEGEVGLRHVDRARAPRDRDRH